MPNKNIYFNRETNGLLEDLSKKLGKPFSQVIEIALNKYRDDVESRSMEQFRKCHEQLGNSIMYLQACRDYGADQGHPEPWSDKDDEILELLNKAHDPLMYYNNALIHKEHPDWFDEDGDLKIDKIAE
jgi:hypothetical protein